MASQDDSVAALFSELKKLRRGLGINDPTPVREFPDLGRICGVTSADGPGQARRKIATELERLAGRLEEPHRTIARAALGFGAEPGARYLQRLASLTVAYERDQRTIQRRSDDALRLLAELAIADGGAVGAGRPRDPWHTRTFRATVLLDEPQVEAIEARRITSHVDGLDRIEHSITLAPPDGGTGRLDLETVRLRAIAGGDVVSRRLVAAKRAEFGFRLTDVLNAGDEHEIEFQVRVPHMSPYYFCTPTYPCELFDLRIRFDRERVPARIAVVEGAFANEADDPTVNRETITADTSGLVQRVFRDLEPYRSYGLLWSQP